MGIVPLATFLFFIALASSENQSTQDANELTETEEENCTTELRGLQKEFAKYFQLKKYNEMDYYNLNRIISSLQIKDSDIKRLFLIDHTICNLCNFLMGNLKNRRITIEVVGRAICNIYISLSTLTITDFCKDIIEINKIAKQPYAEPLKVLHLTDVHISFDYEVNGVSNCGYPICCKKGLGNPIKGQNAGYWGDYNCDIPPWLYTNTLEEITSRHKDIGFVYFTGDIIDHTVWKGSKQNHKEMMQYTFDMLEKHFPNKIILPVIGNHESLPLNIYAPPQITDDRFSQKWLYELMAKLWRKWLPRNALDNVRKQGYYSYYIRRNLKIIALNNNICYIYNWWVLYDTIFLDEQLAFLRTELEAAEQRGHFVHIIAHVPPGNKECIEPWEKNYSNLISRYSHIIKGQFFGHTHTDELKVFYNDKKEPINVGYNGASLTPFIKYNPNYKILKLDPQTYDVVNIDTYTFNLSEANLTPKRFPKWYKLYSMKEAYSFDIISPANIDKLAQDMFRNSSLFNQYWRYYIREADASIREGCDYDCKKDLICKITTTESMAPHKNECLN